MTNLEWTLDRLTKITNLAEARYMFDKARTAFANAKTDRELRKANDDLGYWRYKVALLENAK